MDGFSYHNIFDTKGIEYLVIIAFLILLIPFWVILNKQAALKKKMSQALGMLTAGILRIPQGLFYNRNHMWTRLEKSGNARIGVDDLLVHLTGEMSFRNLKEAGDSVRKGEPIGVFDQQGKKLKVYAPVSGEVLNVNEALLKEPGLLTEDPYDQGWLYRIKPSDWKGETASFYVAGETSGWAEKELQRFKDFIAGSARNEQVVLQDGGELLDHSLSVLPEDLWQNFQKEFLDPE